MGPCRGLSSRESVAVVFTFAACGPRFPGEKGRWNIARVVLDVCGRQHTRWGMGNYLTIVSVAALMLAAAPVAVAKGEEKPGAAAAATAMPGEPGRHKRVACPKDPKLTVDIFLPAAYGEKKRELFPVLFLSSPNANPGFLGLEPWAEAHEVILVAINDSKNGDWAPIFAAQEAAWDAVKGLRAHPYLRFATGFSGGGAASAAFAAHHPKEFAGVLLQCHSAFGAKMPRHVSAGFVGGLKDTTHPDSAVRDAATAARAGGRYVQECHPDMGHGWAPKEVTGRIIANQLMVARLSHPGIPEKERQAELARIQKLVASLATETDTAAVCEKLDPLLEPDEFKGKPFRVQALDLWCAARLKEIEALKGDAAFEASKDEVTLARFAECRGKPRAGIDALKRKLDADPALKAENVAWKDYERLSDALDKAQRAGAKPKEVSAIKDKLSALVKKHEGTYAATCAGKLVK